MVGGSLQTVPKPAPPEQLQFALATPVMVATLTETVMELGANDVRPTDGNWGGHIPRSTN
jgi:hypothetical protein